MTPDAKIQRLITRATKYAMTPKDMARLVSLFPEAQRQSIAKSSTYSEGYGDKLNSRIESISKAWKEKYGSDFAISKECSQLFEPDVRFNSFGSAGHNNPNLESATAGHQGCCKERQNFRCRLSARRTTIGKSMFRLR